jgi:hypothetical protein
MVRVDEPRARLPGAMATKSFLCGSMAFIGGGMLSFFE